MFKPLGIPFIVKLYDGLVYLLKLLKETVIFGRSALYCLHATLFLRTVKNLGHNFQKPPLPSKITVYAPVLFYIVFPFRFFTLIFCLFSPVFLVPLHEGADEISCNNHEKLCGKN